jgi:transposase-like protein
MDGHTTKRHRARLEREQHGRCGSQKSEVRRVCEALDEHVEAFRTTPLERRYPYVFLDAKMEKVRDGGRVVAKALVVAHGVHETGRREILSIDVGEAETEAFWTEFLRGLPHAWPDRRPARDLRRARGPEATTQPGSRPVLGSSWQR